VLFPPISADLGLPTETWAGIAMERDSLSPSEEAEVVSEGAVNPAIDPSGQGREVVRVTRGPSLEQRVLFCRCGSSSIYVRGFCQRCYHRDRADRKYFAGLREQALVRDGHRCRGCQGAGADCVLSVHHRLPGRSSLDLLITLCPACHALIERTQVLYRDVPELLRVLWRELHPAASEQLSLFAP
jgi:5-methylcytosine-specific restriction endonuclease McrA